MFIPKVYFVFFIIGIYVKYELLSLVFTNGCLLFVVKFILEIL